MKANDKYNSLGSMGITLSGEQRVLLVVTYPEGVQRK